MTRIHKGVPDDHRLARFARQQHDWFERVKKGSLDPDEVMRAIEFVIAFHFFVFRIRVEGMHKTSMLVDLGRYYDVSDSITDELYPIEEHDVSWRGLEYVKFDHAPTLEEVFEAFTCRDLVPPTPEEALHFGGFDGYHLHDETLVFLCEPVLNLSDPVRVLVLSDDGPREPLVFGGNKKRSLRRCLFGEDWNPEYVFAGVHPVEAP